jgi:hypothetical protein
MEGLRDGRMFELLDERTEGRSMTALKGRRTAMRTRRIGNFWMDGSSSLSSSLVSTALREPWPPVLFASTGLYPALSFSILQSPSLVGPPERHLAI